MTITMNASARREQLQEELDELICRFRMPEEPHFDAFLIATRIGFVCSCLEIPRDRYPGTLGLYPETIEG
jgi:hypothetical protein